MGDSRCQRRPPEHSPNGSGYLPGGAGPPSSARPIFSTLCELPRDTPSGAIRYLGRVSKFRACLNESSIGIVSGLPLAALAPGRRYSWVFSHTLQNIAADRDWWLRDSGAHYGELATWLREVACKCRLPNPQRELLRLARTYERRAVHLDRRARRLLPGGSTDLLPTPCLERRPILHPPC